MSSIYTIDIFHDIFFNGRLVILLVLFFGFSLLFALYGIAVKALSLPITLATDEDSSTGMRIVSILIMPLGLVGGFLLWQAQNWVLYGLLNVEPWLYNIAFTPLGLGE